MSDLNEIFICPHCAHSLLRESLPLYYNGTRISSLGSPPRYNLHCLNCDHYFIENWREFNYYNFESSSRVGKPLRRMRRQAAAKHRSPVLANSPPYCLVSYHRPMPIPRDFHEMWLRYKAEEKKKLMV
jgi:hypothetical protein